MPLGPGIHLIPAGPESIRIKSVPKVELTLLEGTFPYGSKAFAPVRIYAERVFGLKLSGIRIHFRMVTSHFGPTAIDFPFPGLFKRTELRCADLIRELHLIAQSFEGKAVWATLEPLVRGLQGTSIPSNLGANRSLIFFTLGFWADPFNDETLYTLGECNPIP